MPDMRGGVLLSDPVLRVAFDSGNHDAATDMLIEREATLGDVLSAFAGTPPNWLDGMPKEVLVLWLKATELSKPTPAGYLFTGDRVIAQCRWEHIETIREDVQLIARTVSANSAAHQALLDEAQWSMTRGRSPTGLPGGHPALQNAFRLAKRVAKRDVKRKVLALFPEVKSQRECYVSDVALHIVDDMLLVNGIRRDRRLERITEQPGQRRLVYRQALAAPDWIRPEWEGDMDANLLAQGEQMIDQLQSSAE